MKKMVFKHIVLNLKSMAMFFAVTFICVFLCCADSWCDYFVEILEFSTKMGLIAVGLHFTYTCLMLASAFVYPKISPKMYKFYKRNIVFTEVDPEGEF